MENKGLTKKIVSLTAQICSLKLNISSGKEISSNPFHTLMSVKNGLLIDSWHSCSQTRMPFLSNKELNI